MQRKLVQVGSHSLMVAIPSKWVQKQGVKKGDSIDFFEVDNKLIIVPVNETFERSIEIKLSSSTIEYVWRVLQPIYTSGYDDVTLYFNDKKALDILQETINLLLGFEIVDTGDNFVKIKSISKQLDSEFDSILKRIFYVLHQMFFVYKEIFEENNKKRLKEITTLETTINKYTMFLKRIINRQGYKYHHYMFEIISFLELSANHLEYIKRYLLEKKSIAIDKEIKNEFLKLYDLYNKIYDLYYDYSDTKFRIIAELQPHFNWFDKIKDETIKFNFKFMAEYLVQISRQIVALNIIQKV
jgi:phosphate uptake regulator